MRKQLTLFLLILMPLILVARSNTFDPALCEELVVEAKQYALTGQDDSVGIRIDQAVQLYASEEDYFSQLYLYYDIGMYYSSDRKMIQRGRVNKDLALVYWGRGLEMTELEVEEWMPEEQELFFQLYLNRADVYRKKGWVARAREEYEQAERLLPVLLKAEETYEDFELSNQPVELAEFLYKPLGNIYTRLEAYEGAATYLTKALQQFESAGAQNLSAITLSDLGYVMMSQRRLSEAATYFQKGFALQGINEEARIALLINRANLFFYQSQLRAANADISAAILALKSRGDVERGIEALGIQAAILRAQGAWQQAEAVYREAIEYRARSCQGVCRKLAKLYNQLGNLYADAGEEEKAQVVYQQALHSLLPMIDRRNIHALPAIADLKAENTLLETLEGKAQAFLANYKKTNEVFPLELALRCHRLLAQVESALRQHQRGATSKLFAQLLRHERAEQSIGMALTLYERTGQTTFVQTAFQLLEESKALLLLEAAREKQVALGDSSIEAFYNAALPAANTSLFLQNIRSHLDSTTALFAYYVGDDWLYNFTLTTDTLLFDKQLVAPVRDTALALLDNYRQAQLDETALTNPQSYQLYQWLLKNQLDALPPRIQQLLILPDEFIAFLPFDALLRQTPELALQTELDPLQLFLIGRYTTCYAYSASYHTISQQLPAPAYPNSWLGIAPSFDQALPNAPLASRGCMDGQPGPLRHNQDEVERIEALVGGELLLAEQASKTAFLNTPLDYQVLHFATHACADPADPSGSSIYMYDDVLQAADLANQRLAAELVVLSACETGVGVYQRGEGVLSLARIFAIQGSPHLIMSLWKANDRTTAELMPLFYQFLPESPSIAEALRQAKLHYLSEQETLHSMHPNLWATFVYYGHHAPFHLQNQPSRWWMLLIPLSLFFVFILFAKRRSLFG